MRRLSATNHTTEVAGVERLGLFARARCPLTVVGDGFDHGAAPAQSPEQQGLPDLPDGIEKPGPARYPVKPLGWPLEHDRPDFFPQHMGGKHLRRRLKAAVRHHLRLQGVGDDAEDAAQAPGRHDEEVIADHPQVACPPGRLRQRRPLPRPLPGHAVLLTAAPQRPPPEVDDLVTERTQCPRVRGHRVVGEEAGDHLLEPSSLRGNGLAHCLPERWLNDEAPLQV